MEIAALGLKADSSDIREATIALKELPPAATAAERAAQRWGVATTNAGRSTEDFSRRVQGTIRSLEFERQQLARNATEQQKHAALRRAGVAASSAEGQAILASVAALQAQRAAIQRTADETKKGNDAAQTFTSSWRSLLAIAGGVMGVGAITRAADSFTTLTNAIKVTGATGAALEYTQQRLFKSANDNGVGVDALGTLYSRTAMAGKELGISQESLLEFTDGVTAALRLQGGSAEQASGALLQLSQALGGGVIQAEEFNSLLDGAMPVVQAVANGIDRFKGSVSALRAEVKQGTVTSKEFFDGALKGFAETRRLAGASTLTTAQSLASLNNRFIDLVGQMDKATGVSRAFGAAFDYVGRKLEETSKDVQAGQNAPAIFLEKIIKGLGDAIEWFKRFDQQMIANGATLRAWLSENITTFVDNFELAGARAVAGFLGAFQELPQRLGGVFRNAMNEALDAVEKGINFINKNASSWFSSKDRAPVNLGRLTEGPDAFVGPLQQPGVGAADIAEQRKRAEQQAVRDARARDELLARQAGMQGDEARARLGGMPVSGPLGLGGGVAPPGKKGSDPYAKTIESAKEYILTKKAETEAVGQSVLAAAQLKHEQELLNKATDEGKTLSLAQKAALKDLAGQMAQADSTLATAKFMDDAKKKSEEFISTQELERQTLFMSAEAADALRFSTEMLNQARQAGIDLTPAQIDAINQSAAAMAAAKAKTEEIKQVIDLGREVFKGFFADIRQGLMNGQSLWESFGNAAINALNRIAEKLVEMAATKLFESAFGGSSGGGLGGLLGGLFGGGGGGITAVGGGFDAGAAGGLAGGFMPGFAKGAAFGAGNVIPFAKGDVFSNSTLFPMSGGRTGVLGEAGPEAIMPLKRGPGGRLGVEAANSNRQQPIVVNVYANEGFVRAEAEGAAVRVVNNAAPGIEARAVKRSGQQAPAAVERQRDQSGGDWRFARA